MSLVTIVHLNIISLLITIKNAMLPLENSESPLKMFSNTHEVTAETKENRTIYTQVFEIDNGIEKDALITGIPYVICQQANMLFIFVVGKILPRRVI